MASITITNANGLTVFTYTGKNLLTDFILQAEPGEYHFVIHQGDVQQRGSFNVAKGAGLVLDHNQKGMLNYITKYAPVRRDELAIAGRALAEELVDKGLVRRTDDLEYFPV